MDITDSTWVSATVFSVSVLSNCEIDAAPKLASKSAQPSSAVPDAGPPNEEPSTDHGFAGLSATGPEIDPVSQAMQINLISSWRFD